MDKHILKVLIALMFSSFIFSQSAVADTKKTIQLSMAVGAVSLNDIAAVNEELEKANKPTFDDSYITFGGMIRLRFDRLLIDMEAHGFRADPEENGNYESVLSGGYTFIGVGYDIFQTESIALYPIVGIGGGAIRMDIYEKDEVAFADAVNTPGRGVTLTKGNVILHVAIGFDYFFKLFDSGGPILGIQLGYNQALKDGDWKMFPQGDDDKTGGTKVTNGPDFAFTGFVGNFNFGWKFLL